MKELACIAKWIERNSSQQVERIERDANEKTMGNKVCLITNCPDSKPFFSGGLTTARTSNICLQFHSEMEQDF
jgi:hypothetical protein